MAALLANGCVLFLLQRLSVCLGHGMLRPVDSHADVVRLTEILVGVVCVVGVLVDNAGVETQATHQMVFLTEDLTASLASRLVDLDTTPHKSQHFFRQLFQYT